LSDEEGSYEEIPESTKQRYAEMGEDSDHCDSFGDPNFDKLIHKGPKNGKFDENNEMIKIVDYNERVNTHFDPKSRLNYDIKKKGYITPSLGSTKGTKHFEFNANYDEEMEIPEHEDELMSYNNQLVEDAKAFIFGKHSPKHQSRNKNLEFDQNKHNFATQGNEESPVFPPKSRNTIKRLVTESDQFGSDGLDNYDNYSFLRGNHEHIRNLTSKNSNGLSNNGENKLGFAMATETSAIDCNQSQDFDEFDDILNTLDKGFKQRKTNHANKN
jgi:hypothetical protein